MPFEIPESYSSLDFPNITLSHHNYISNDVSGLPTLPSSILIITLSRPDALNTFTSAMGHSLISVISTASIDPRIKVIVIAGNSTSPAFCAGADVTSEFKRSTVSSTSVPPDLGGQVSMAIHSCPKPVLAAIHGTAVGVGITMTLPCTIRITHKNAKIGFVFARRGLVPEACSTYFLPRLVGVSNAAFLLSAVGQIGPVDRPPESSPFGTRGVVKASHPAAAGLFAEIVDRPDQVLPTALRMAEEIAIHTSLVSNALIKHALSHSPATPYDAHLIESDLLHNLFESRDNTEGVQAFLQKRQPLFTGTIERDLPKIYPWGKPSARL